MHAGIIEDTVFELLKKMATRVPPDVYGELAKAYAKERQEFAKGHLGLIMKNIRLARRKSWPLCQDTGVLHFHVRIGPRARLPQNFEKKVLRGVAKATREVPLRENVAHPLTRKNTGNNLGTRMPYFSYGLLPRGDAIQLSVVPKAGGCENWSTLQMFHPSKGWDDIRAFILDWVATSGGRSCTPNVLGVGIGGTGAIAMELADRASLRPLHLRNRDRFWAKLEADLLRDINSLGIGPMGVGGDTTLLSVNVEAADTHTSMLPVGVVLQCWALRREAATIRADGSVRFSNRGAV